MVMFGSEKNWWDTMRQALLRLGIWSLASLWDDLIYSALPLPCHTYLQSRDLPHHRSIWKFLDQYHLNKKALYVIDYAFLLSRNK